MSPPYLRSHLPGASTARTAFSCVPPDLPLIVGPSLLLHRIPAVYVHVCLPPVNE